MHPFAFTDLPPGFAALENEPEFDPARHLQLEAPETVYRLGEFGYEGESLADAPVDFAATSVFRIMSEEGAAHLYRIAKSLEPFTTSNARVERNLRGGVYRSKYLRDLCLSPDVAEFMSEIAGIDLMPHTIAHQLGHINFNPPEIGRNVDKWHVDTLRFDYVMFITDPRSNEGGQFQYFKGTRDEVDALKRAGKPLPPDRIISPDMPGAGYGIFQQGSHVVHRAKGLTRPGERITMVNGYIPRDPAFPDHAAYGQLLGVDPAEVVTIEYGKHAADHARRYIERYLLRREFADDREGVADDLEKAASILQSAARHIRAGRQEIEHFGED
ncbi:MAG: hypothetical protein ISN28_16075 [Ectothiorhodospiraceae bacterium AqS1]|nr:hypothetical protein [Ectothiorhodospiraceae bacterium AqS1]